MKIKSLQDLEVFVRTADCGSLSAAARLLGISPAVASVALKRLESDLDLILFVRTTRSMRLTPEGETLLARCRPLLEGFREAEEELGAGHALIGSLQISMPSDLGRNLILPWLDEFQTRYPRVHLRIQVSDRLADIYRQPVDIAIRYGTPPSSGLVALPLVQENRRVLCAAPAYLRQYGTPASPHELTAHNCLCFMLNDTVYDSWRFWKGDKESLVNVRGNRLSDDSDAVRRWAVAGYGVVYRSRIDVVGDLVAGRLQLLCPDWLGESVPLHLVCADRRQLSPTVRLLREFLEIRFNGLVGTAGRT
ncbi:MAG: LysR family transcriptional regulator [Methylophilaceae bacterium]|uniref:LysR family transcriptional regulator n=1 Tax=Methylobacillus sp. MM3 TaxID=1848039 RepID=UPI0007E0693B|nr:LysR family transcriptional regulator [Methylobacillus sp. MM3]OAJ69903.1 LysR family transcriptional regulator [Methylobacillus sp. MM3]HSI95724.1 LysR family transcriptional regulator [Methylophilaceae bacterium]